jgi:hypothetical protein
MCAITSPAYAQDDAARARALFDEGRRLAEAEQWDEAVVQFRAALALRPTGSIRYDLGVALYRSGHLLEASETLRAVTRDADTPDEIRGAAEGLAHEIEPRLAHLRVSAESSEPFEIALDGRALPRDVLGVEAPIDPGAHRVEMRVHGELVDHRELSLDDGSREEVTLHYAPPQLVARPSTHRMQARTATGTRYGPAPLAVGIGAGVIAITALSTSLAAFVMHDRAEAALRAYESSPSMELYNRANERVDLTERLNVTSDVLWGVSLAAAITTIVLALTDGPAERAPEVALGVGPSSAMLIIGERWQ